MRSRIPGFAMLVCLATGCQLSTRVSQQYELLNAEKRTLEDELYALQFEYDDAIDQLEALRSENSQLKARLGLPAARSGPPPVSRSRSGEAAGPDLSPPLIDESGLTEPKIEIPEEMPSPAPNGQSSLAPPVPPQVSRTPPGAFPPPGASLSGSEVTPALSEAPTDPRVTHIYLNPLLTGGGNFDDQPGDDGLVVVIEPRNRSDLFVPLAGPVSVVLLDPQQAGEAARFAKWEFDAPAVRDQMRDTAKGKGIHLRLPWPAGTPPSGRMHLFVRYVTVDGRKLEADRELFLSLPGQITQRWTPRPAGPARSAIADNSGSQWSRSISPRTDVSEPQPDRGSVQPAGLSEPVRPELSRPALAVPDAERDEEKGHGTGTAAEPVSGPSWRPYR